MSASRNKSKPGGLRFLWIPGRKKHNRKGHYDTTSKPIKYSGGSFGQKNNAPWSLGGNKGLEKLIESDIPGASEGGSRIIAALPAAYSLAAGASTTVAMRLDETNQFAMIDDEKDISNDEYSKSPDMNSVKGNNDDDCQSKSNGHTNNVNKSEKNNRDDKKEDHREKSKDNVNSIESLNDKKFKDSSFDITDSSLYVNKYNNKKKNKKKKKKNKQNCAEEEEEDPDAKIVKCLYFTLMCCECTIS